MSQARFDDEFGRPADEPQPEAAGWGPAAHLSGKHDQRRHGRKLPGLSRPGMGDVPIDAKWQRNLQGGSAAPHLIRHADGSAQFSPERQAIHDRIVNDTLAGKSPPEGQPVYHVLGGGPAAGKSSLLKTPEGQGWSEGTAHIAFDDLRAQLPGYEAALAADPQGAARFHMESAYLTSRVTAAAAERGLSMTLDTTGNSSPETMRNRIGAARQAGYRIEGHYTTIPTSVAIERADFRAAHGTGSDAGRYVNHEGLTNIHAAISQTLPQVVGDFDNLELFDNSGPQGSTPRRIMSWDGSNQTIHDAGTYQAFLDKAGEAPGHVAVPEGV